MKAKAVLEYIYPDDEEEFKHAMHGERAIKCIKQIEEMILKDRHERNPMTKTLEDIRILASNLLREVE
jgi:hypothetical protein